MKIHRFLIYGLIGWCVEIFWTGSASLLKGDLHLQAHTYLWMFPIYGLAIFLEPIHNSIRDKPVIVRGVIYTTLIFIVEYLAGWLLQLTIGHCPWDYSSQLFSVNGFIRLDYAPAWFVASLLFERLHDTLIKVVPLAEN